MNKVIFILSMILLISCSNTNTTNTTFSDKEEYYILRGINYSQNKDYKNAVEQLEIAYSKNRNNTIVMKELAYCYFELGNKDKATKIYREVLKKDPKDKIALKNLAFISYEKGNFQETQFFLNSVCESERELFYYKLQGYIYEEQKNYKMAYKYFNIIGRSKEENYDSKFFYSYTETLIQLEKKGELYKLLGEKYSLYFSSKEFVKLYSKLMFSEFNEYEKSERAMKRYIIANPLDNEMILNLVELNIENGDYIKGREQLVFVEDEYRYDKRYIELNEKLNRENVE